MKKFLNIFTVLVVGALCSPSTASSVHDDGDLTGSYDVKGSANQARAAREKEADGIREVSAALKGMSSKIKFDHNQKTLLINTQSLPGDEWANDQRPEKWEVVGAFEHIDSASSALVSTDIAPRKNYIAAALKALNTKKSNDYFRLSTGILTDSPQLIKNGFRNMVSGKSIGKRPAGYISDQGKWKVMTNRDIAKRRLGELWGEINK
jgi:hypothetical protein